MKAFKKMANMAMAIKLIIMWDKGHVCVSERRGLDFLRVEQLVEALPNTLLMMIVAEVLRIIFGFLEVVVVRGEARRDRRAVEFRELEDLTRGGAVRLKWEVVVMIKIWCELMIDEMIKIIACCRE